MNSVYLVRSMRHDLYELGPMTAPRIDVPGPLPDQTRAHAARHRRALGLVALHRNQAHRRAQCGLTDRFGIGRIVKRENGSLDCFLVRLTPPLDERLDVGGWDQPNVVVRLADLATPKMSAAASFDRHNAGRALAKNSCT